MVTVLHSESICLNSCRFPNNVVNLETCDLDRFTWKVKKTCVHFISQKHKVNILLVESKDSFWNDYPCQKKKKVGHCITGLKRLLKVNKFNDILINLDIKSYRDHFLLPLWWLLFSCPFSSSNVSWPTRCPHLFPLAHIFKIYYVK